MFASLGFVCLVNYVLIIIRIIKCISDVYEINISKLIFQIPFNIYFTSS